MRQAFPYGAPTAFSRVLKATGNHWPRCTNSEPGTFGSECGRPASCVTQRPGSEFQAYACDRCASTGYEASRGVIVYALPPIPGTARDWLAYEIGMNT